MEPKKVIKKFQEFTDINYPRGIFNHEIHGPTQSIRRIMELPMGDFLGLLRVDSEVPTMLEEQVSLPMGMYSEDFPRTMRGGMNPQPIRVRFRDGINLTEIELQDSIWDWANTSRKKNVCIKTLDPTGVEIERWNLRGCFPTQITYDLIPGNDEHLYLEMTLNWDYLMKEILE